MTRVHQTSHLNQLVCLLACDPILQATFCVIPTLRGVLPTDLSPVPGPRPAPPLSGEVFALAFDIRGPSFRIAFDIKASFRSELNPV